jgi:hypothetical protein
MSNPKSPPIATVAKEIASNAMSKRYPKMSIAAQLRRLSGSPARVTRVKEMAEHHLAARLAKCRPAQGIEEGAWLSLAEAARVLEISAHRLQERLKIARFRRLYGWPWHDGRRWRIAASALAPATRAAFLSSLPSDEPHSDLLPSWCQRQATDPFK